MRVFDTGAKRDNEDGKIDYEGHLSPLTIKAYAEYMNQHRLLEDGSYRASDNWKKGIPLDVYIKSMYRHMIDLLLHHGGYSSRTEEDLQDAICGLKFNVDGYLHEIEQAKVTGLLTTAPTKVGEEGSPSETKDS